MAVPSATKMWWWCGKKKFFTPLVLGLLKEHKGEKPGVIWLLKVPLVLASSPPLAKEFWFHITITGFSFQEVFC